MKTTHTKGPVDTNTTASNNFTILANGKAFKVLIDGLYANKIQSITREIWSNALDSHVEAGCVDTPFLVSFPTEFYPTFSVRDYGVGLSHDDVMEMYTTVFKSTKEDTNEQVGKLGLGSKSPFAYTDTFTVTSITGGVKRFYAAVIGEDGIPTINFMGEEATEDPRGVEVAFPVRLEDTAAFRKAAQNVARGFDVQPVTDRSETFTGWKDHEVAYSGDNWQYFTEQSSYGSTNKAYAKMGCVLYPIDATAMSGLTELQKSFLETHVVMEFDIGDLEITASREALSYGSDEPTTASIIRVVDDIIDTMADDLMMGYQSKSTYWEACTSFVKDMTNKQLPSAVRDTIKEFATFEGEPLKTSINVGEPRYGLAISLMDNQKIRRVKHAFTPVKNSVTSVSRSDTTLFLVQDRTTEKRVIRINDRIKYLINHAEVSPNRVVWLQVTSERGFEALEKFKADLGGATFHDVNSVELPKAAPVYRSPVAMRIMDNEKGGFNEKDYYTEGRLEEGGFYVPLTRMEPVLSEGQSGPKAMREALVDCEVLSEYVTVYGIPKSLLKNIDHSIWTNIYDLAETSLNKFTSGKKGDLTRQRAALLIKQSNLFRIANDCATRIPDGSPMKDVCLFAQSVNSINARDVRVFSKLEERLRKVDFDTHSLLDDKKAMENIVAVDYPMLAALSSYTGSPWVDMVVEYVNSQDNNRITTAYEAVA